MTPLSVDEWARERLDNSIRIAATKSGADRDGWLEDVVYWQDIVAALAALRSIANNSCCAPCREAGMVARHALQATGEHASISAVDPQAQHRERGLRAKEDPS